MMMFFNTSKSTAVSNVCSGQQQRKHQGTESVVFGEGIPPLIVTKTSQPVASYTILNTDEHIWTNLFITAFSNTNTVLRKYITSQWRYARDMTSQITGNSTVVFRLNKGDIKAQHYWPFVRGIHRYIIIITTIFIINDITIFIIIISIIIIIVFNFRH